ncbi:Phosphatidate cytidylyltransferase, mitochondrial [Araneus ventricosus]|uniref:Phosphatidate cytidylyltransferase, mitochondrial n=1 Tax=Araneus ventricosus TaxID=182803 RepID=A0A4Y2H9M5_ARAVE|nr:Phosphatidate cytidylyltransferase, mitochondrial [Araneus ventricosus]
MASASVKVFDSVLSKFPQKFSFVFAYGSKVFSQGTKLNEGDMIDFVFTVDNPLEWHKANMQTNHKHYSFIKYAGAEFIKNIQENFGAKMYFNTLVEVENKLIKYGVISTAHLIEDLLDWQTLYISGRLHKPVKVLKKIENTDIHKALQINLQSALHASLLCLPETFSEIKLFLKIAELSYSGDFRMHFGEDKQKIENIVQNQVSYFRDLYADQLKLMPQLHWNQSQCTIEQDSSSATTLHHLNLLPKTVQHNLLAIWNRDGRYRDLEDVLQSLAHDPQCSEMVEKAIRDITLWSSISQSTKGILTAGIMKSLKYSSRKVKKMIKSMK